MILCGLGSSCRQKVVKEIKEIQRSIFKSPACLLSALLSVIVLQCFMKNVTQNLLRLHSRQTDQKDANSV